MRLANRGADHAIRALDHMVAAAVQLKENERCSRLSCMCHKDLFWSPMEHGPTHRDASIAQITTPFFASARMIIRPRILVCRVSDMDTIQMRAHFGSQMAGKIKNIVRSAE
jgi:hypothetical protein